MPFKYQILITPAVMMLMLSGLVWFTLDYHADIHEQNEIIRQWGRVTDRLHVAIGAGQRMQSVIKKMTASLSDQDEDYLFEYVEQYQIISDNMICPECFERITLEKQAYIEQSLRDLLFTEQLDVVTADKLLNVFLPQLETTYKSLWAKKRGAYIEYYDNLQITESNLFNVSMAILVLCVAVGLALSFWTITVTRKRLAVLSTSANQICKGDLRAASAPVVIRDEIDELSMCLSLMTERLIGVVAIDKLLEGAEEERKRIAMDMHDQVLSNLTTLTRQIDSLRLKQLSPDELFREYENLLSNIDETRNDIRRILDDLHPRTLDHLGLEAATRSFLEKNVATIDSLSYYLNVDTDVDQYLSDYQRLSLYRIIQEAVHNIIRHARCSKLEISLRHTNHRIILLIEDNGIGMKIDNALLIQGRGLTHIKERARSIGANISWLASRFSSGVKLDLRLPVSNVDIT